MTTVWNKTKVEAFSDAIPLKSNIIAVPPLVEGFFDRTDGSTAQVSLEDVDVDNVKDFGTPEDAPDLDVGKPVTNEQSAESDTSEDISSIKDIVTLFLTVMLSMHVAFMWYFNITQGLGEATFHLKLDFLNAFSFVTGYLYNIIKFIDVTLIERLSTYAKYMIDNTFLKDRFLFIVLLGVSTFIVKYLLDFNVVIVEQISAKKFNLKKLPGPNSLFSLLYFGFVAYGLFDAFKEGGPIANFIALNPIISMIGLIILVAILYVPTISVLPFFLFVYIAYYSLIGVTPHPDSLYNKVSSMGFYKALISIINVKHVMYEMHDDSSIKNAIESVLRALFKYLPYFIIVAGLIPVLIKSLDIHTASIKYSFIGIIIATMAGTIGSATSLI